VGASVWMLVAGLRGNAATIARVAAVIFVLFYDIGDAVAGIATGLLAGNAAGGYLPETAAVTAINAIFKDFTKDVFFGVGILA
jgi:Na+/phosphate symporter